MTVFCVNGEKYNRIKALLYSEKRLAYNGAGICGSAAIYVLEAKINYLRHYANTYVMR